MSNRTFDQFCELKKSKAIIKQAKILLKDTRRNNELLDNVQNTISNNYTRYIGKQLSFDVAVKIDVRFFGRTTNGGYWSNQFNYPVIGQGVPICSFCPHFVDELGLFTFSTSPEPPE